MMFKKWKKVVFILFSLLVLPFSSVSAMAQESSALPLGEILIIYSDGASVEDIENVKSMVEYLTYQRFQVTYAPALECLGELKAFSCILCYKLERYPKELIIELKEREDKGNAILKAREGIQNSSGENDIRLLFVGNDFIRTYLNETGMEHSYIDSTKQTGKMQYYFSDSIAKEALVKENNFLFLSDELDYQAGTLEVEGTAGYICARIGALSHIPVTDFENNLVKAAFIREAAKWKWPYNGEPHTYAQYMVLDQIYPFQNTKKLLQIVNYFIAKKEPFVITVMPVYNHGNYPAMQRFCEVLRYAQANGGTILLHSPINQMPDFDIDLVNEYITAAIDIYVEQGVYPMGIQVPRNWMFNCNTIEVMSHFRTVLVSEEEDTLIQDAKDVNTNLVYKDGHQWIAPSIPLDSSNVSYLKTNSFAVFINITEDMDMIENKINTCISSFVPLKSLWDIEHSFWTEEDVMNYKNHIILINGKRIENNFTATAYDENFKYNRNRLQRYSKDLSKVNKKLVAAVVATCLIFFWFILMARYRNKQTFFIKKSKKEKKKKGE
jgi:hypothetical protein